MVQLFLRRSHGLELTDAARRYLPVVRDSFDRLAAATSELRRPQLASVLTVSASPNFASKWLIHRLGDFARDFPDVDLRVAAEQQHIDLSTSDVDIGIRHGEGQWRDLHVTKLVGERVYPVISPALLANGPPLDTPDDLRHHTLLRDLSSNDWPAWLKAAGAMGVDGTKGPYFNFTSMALDAAVCRTGCGTCPPRTCDPRCSLGSSGAFVRYRAHLAARLLRGLPTFTRGRTQSRQLPRMGACADAT